MSLPSLLPPLPPLQHEISELISRALDDSLDAPGHARLEEILKNSPEARAYYVRFMGMSAGLAWAARGMQAPSPVPVQHHPRFIWPAFSWRRFAAAAAVLVLAALGVWLALYRPPVAAPVEPCIATLSAAESIEWETAQEPRHQGNALLPGWIRIKSGLAQIDFISGVSVWLEGPAAFQLVSARSGYLESGKLVAQVPQGATRGFQVKCPLGTIVDRGTAFGVEMKAGRVGVHVFAGLVEITPKSGVPLSYAAGQATMLDGSGVPRPIFFEPRLFDYAGYGWGFNSFGVMGAMGGFGGAFGGGFGGAPGTMGPGANLPGGLGGPIWTTPNWKGWEPLGFVREQLDVSDERWGKIQPALSTYIGARWELDSLGFVAPISPFARAAWELWWGTQNANTTEEELENRLAAYRETREEKVRERDMAEERLKALLAPKEQAILLDMGYLR